LSETADELIIYPQITAAEYFVMQVKSLNEVSVSAMINRCRGQTLKEIGDSIGVTRERVRQILIRLSIHLRRYADIVADTLICPENPVFSYEQLRQLFTSDEMADCCRFVLQQSEYVQYIKFADKFVLRSVFNDNIEKAMKQFIDDIAKTSINFSYMRKEIKDSLQKNGLDFLQTEDIKQFLKQAGYQFYGEFAVSGNRHFASACCDAVRRFFPFDIKLDSNKSNKDMNKLRQIITQYYPGIILPDNNRALTARLSSTMILSGRGRYCPVEKVHYNFELFEEIRSFIVESHQTTFYYSEIFEYFKDNLHKETNINNFHFLHGALKYLYSDLFVFERDLLVKKESDRCDIKMRLTELILNKGSSVTKDEIKEAIPGINSVVIAFTAMRLPELIQWEYNEFNHIDNIYLSDDELNTLENILKELTDKNGGYATDSLLYYKSSEMLGDTLERNRIKNIHNLYYIASYYFGNQYKFKRPHIISDKFDIQELTVANIARSLLKCDESLNYLEYNKLVESLGWAVGTVYAVFYELEKDFLRISEDDYVKKDKFHISESAINEVSNQINRLISDSEYYPIGSIDNYHDFPPCAYSWNGFLLESVLRNYCKEFRIISPNVRDRRYQKGIIVKKDCRLKSFEDIVVNVLKKDGITDVSQSELIKHLQIRGLSSKMIPKEIYDCPQIQVVNKNFIIA